MTYAERKERIREKAQNWQAELCNRNYTFAEIAFFAEYFAEYFERQGKRYGLIREFRENGII